MTLTAPSLEQFRTPRGRAASLYTREGTSDHNNVLACLQEDEYGIAALNLHGTALDIGAHIGGVTIALALDNPDLHVIAVEALSANIEVLTANVEANGIADRVTIVHGAADKPGKKSSDVHWGFDDNETGSHHRFIGNAQLLGITGGDVETVNAWQLPTEEIAFAKIDCEGCEYNVFASPNVKHIALIVGEFHGGFEQIVDLLGGTHVVTQTSGIETFGGFKAVRR